MYLGMCAGCIWGTPDGIQAQRYKTLLKDKPPEQRKDSLPDLQVSPEATFILLRVSVSWTDNSDFFPDGVTAAEKCRIITIFVKTDYQ